MVGVDIVAINRIERLLKKYNISFLKNFLCQSEIDLCVKGRKSCDFGDLSCFNIERIAGFYAAKEAIAKALRCGISKNLTFKDIILSKDFQGAPKAKLSKRAKKRFGIKKIHLSISHERGLRGSSQGGYAVAFVMIKKC
ncbi:holo-ACP synthase [Helicobacter sp. 23-1044]